MFCKHCGTEIKEGYKFCPKCGAQMGETTKTEKKPDGAPKTTKTPTAPKGPVIDVKDITVKKPVIEQIEETIDFKKIESILETEGLKVEPFKGIFSKPSPSEVRVENISKIYEPLFVAKASYRGMFEQEKDFPLALDPGTAKVVIEGKEYPVKAEEGGKNGFLTGKNAPKLTLNATLTVIKTGENAIYVNMSGIEKPNIGQFVEGKKTAEFDVKKKISGRVQIPKAHYDVTSLKDRVLVPTIIQRPPKFKKALGESITVEFQTLYYPKYKVLCLNMKNHQSKHLYVSAVDGKVLTTETF